MEIARKLSDADMRFFNRLLKIAGEWATENQVAVGLAEMAAGAAVISLGVHAGVIQLGAELVGSHSDFFNPGEIVGASLGGGAGVLAGYVIGGIGLAGTFGAIGVPAALVAGGASVLLAASGYTLGDTVFKLANQLNDVSPVVGASTLMVGVALLLDGARRVLGDEHSSRAISALKDGVLYLMESRERIVIRTMSELRAFGHEMTSLPSGPIDAVGTIGSVATTSVVGGVVGGSIAAGSVTFLGSHALGTAALALGFVSAPVWPILVGVVGGATVGYAGWKALKALAQR